MVENRPWIVVSLVSVFALADMRRIACSTHGTRPKYLKLGDSSNIFHTKLFKASLECKRLIQEMLISKNNAV
jgi:hypothetical protein